jgi:hypothetical protein
MVNDGPGRHRSADEVTHGISEKLEETRKMRDPVARAMSANEVLNEANMIARQALMLRDRAVRDMVATGESYASVAAEVGLSKSMIAKIATDHA